MTRTEALTFAYAACEQLALKYEDNARNTAIQGMEEFWWRRKNEALAAKNIINDILHEEFKK